ncbi:hypothetical protein HPB50_018465 [Hyalomma asiaticum]|uniref:Uncharacterized protein n=1 Tax=Hyalomma asiaticum TaxID=266040 RepID=A0ACB7TMH4_HYAAI|nr:hypothetical protein HPB50_018465 [Hyalomma asiaticum]
MGVSLPRPRKAPCGSVAVLRLHLKGGVLLLLCVADRRALWSGSEVFVAARPSFFASSSVFGISVSPSPGVSSTALARKGKCGTGQKSSSRIGREVSAVTCLMACSSAPTPVLLLVNRNLDLDRTLRDIKANVLSRYCACTASQKRANRCATQKAYPNVSPALGERPHLGCGTAFTKRMPAHGDRRAARSAQAPRPRPCEPRAAQCSTRRRRLNRPAVQASQSASIGLERADGALGETAGACRSQLQKR